MTSWKPYMLHIYSLMVTVNSKFLLFFVIFVYVYVIYNSRDIYYLLVLNLKYFTWLSLAKVSLNMGYCLLALNVNYIFDSLNY